MIRVGFRFSKLADEEEISVLSWIGSDLPLEVTEAVGRKHVAFALGSHRIDDGETGLGGKVRPNSGKCLCAVPLKVQLRCETRYHCSSCSSHDSFLRLILRCHRHRAISSYRS